MLPGREHSRGGGQEAAAAQVPAAIQVAKGTRMTRANRLCEGVRCAYSQEMEALSWLEWHHIAAPCIMLTSPTEVVLLDELLDDRHTGHLTAAVNDTVRTGARPVKRVAPAVATLALAFKMKGLGASRFTPCVVHCIAGKRRCIGRHSQSCACLPCSLAEVSLPRLTGPFFGQIVGTAHDQVAS